jgi:CheY-like chemotaxis protein
MGPTHESLDSSGTPGAAGAVDSAAAPAASPAHPVILAVDDEPDMLLTLQLYLSTEGFTVMTASNVLEARRRIENRRPDLVITDYTMPGIDGIEFCRMLRERHDTRDIPIIVHTGWDLWEDYPALFDRLVPKPAELDALARLIRSLLSRGP